MSFFFLLVPVCRMKEDKSKKGTDLEDLGSKKGIV